MRSYFTHRLASVAARLFAFALVSGLIFFAPVAQPERTDALGRILTQQNISNTGGQSEIPQIDYNVGRLAAVWGERSAAGFDLNITQLGVTWPRPTFIGTGSMTAYQNADVAVDKAGTAHIVFAAGDRVYHRAKLISGSSTPSHSIASSSFPNAIRMAQAPNGTLWAVWRNGSGSSIFYKFSLDGGVNWSNGSDGGVVASEVGNMFAPDIAVDQNNNPHVVWYLRSGGGYKGDIRFADWTGVRFAKSSLTIDGVTFFDADPSITVDGKNVQHVVWRKQVGTRWAIYYAQRAPGGGWAGYTPVAITNGDAKYAPAIGTDALGTVYITYSDPIPGNARRIQFFSKLPDKGWEGPIALSRGRWDSRSAVVGSITPAGVLAHTVHQHEAGSDDGETIYSQLLIQSCNAQSAPASVAAQDQASKTQDALSIGAGQKLFFPFASNAVPRIPGC